MIIIIIIIIIMIVMHAWSACLPGVVIIMMLC